MRIGLLSDTHGDAARTRRAAALLRQHDVQAVIHCGDIGSQGVLLQLLEAFAPPTVPVYAVLGNVDYSDYVGAGITLCDRFADLVLDGHRVAVIHGDDGGRLQQALASQHYAYLFTGHTHVPDDRREGRTRVINPGAVYRARIPSVALLDTATDQLIWLELERPTG